MADGSSNEFARGARDILPLALGVVFYGAAFGVLATQAGMTGLDVGIMGTLVFAGSAQIVAVERIVAGAGAAAAVIAGLALNLRLVLVSASVRDIYANRPWWQVIIGAHYTTDENWAMMLKRRAEGEEAGWGYMLGSGLVLMVAWLGSGVAGALFASAIPDPKAFGIDFAFAAAFIAIARALWRGRSDLWPWITAAGVAFVCALTGLIDTSWAIVLGGLSGAAVAGMTADV